MSTRLTIAVAEPSLIIRSGLFNVLQRLSVLDINVVEIGDIGQISAQLSRQRPDILIVNPATIGMFSLPQLKTDSSLRNLKCIALLYLFTDSAALKAYDETISIYDTAEQIRDKLIKLADKPDEAEQQNDSLSVREKEIIVCVVKGMTNKQIAEELHISAHTVITHRRNIASKLQIHSSAGLTIYAIVNKLVELNDIKNSISDTAE